MESCFGNVEVAVKYDAASANQADGISFKRIIGSQDETGSKSPRYQPLKEFKFPHPDSLQGREGREMRNRVAVDQQSECATTIYSPLKIPVSAKIADMVTSDEKEHTKSDVVKKKTATEDSNSPSHNIQCIPQLINGVKCITFTTPDDTGHGKRTADSEDGSTKRAKRRLVFPDACDRGTNRDVKRQADAKNSYLCQGIEKASTRADRIVMSLQWDVVKVLREATMVKGKDIVLVKPRGLSWAPSLSALRDKDGTLTVLSDSNMAALFQIEDQLNIDLSSPNVAELSLGSGDRWAKNTPISNVDKREHISNTEEKEANLLDRKKRQRDDLTPENSNSPSKAFTDEISMDKEKACDKHSLLKAKYCVEERNQKIDVPAGKVLPELQTPTEGSVTDDEVRVMKAAIQLLSEIDISTDQCIDLNAIDHAFEEVDKNLQFIDESKLKRRSYEIDQAIAGLHTDWDQISEKLLRDLESIERRLSLAVTEEQYPKERQDMPDVIHRKEGQSSINMEIFGELGFEDDQSYSSLSPGEQQKYLDMLMKEPSILTPYDELIFELIDTDL